MFVFIQLSPIFLTTAHAMFMIKIGKCHSKILFNFSIFENLQSNMQRADIIS